MAYDREANRESTPADIADHYEQAMETAADRLCGWSTPLY